MRSRRPLRPPRSSGSRARAAQRNARAALAARRCSGAGSTPFAASGSILAVAARGELAAQLLFRIAFLARDFLARCLVDDLHRQPHLAALVEAQQLDIDLVALLDDLAHRLGPALHEL